MIGEFFGIDLVAMDAEKDRMLAEMRAAQKGTT